MIGCKGCKLNENRFLWSVDVSGVAGQLIFTRISSGRRHRFEYACFRGTRIFWISAANTRPNLFHQFPTVSGPISMPRARSKPARINPPIPNSSRTFQRAIGVTSIQPRPWRSNVRNFHPFSDGFAGIFRLGRLHSDRSEPVRRFRRYASGHRGKRRAASFA